MQRLDGKYYMILVYTCSIKLSLINAPRVATKERNKRKARLFVRWGKKNIFLPRASTSIFHAVNVFLGSPMLGEFYLITFEGKVRLAISLEPACMILFLVLEISNNLCCKSSDLRVGKFPIS